MASKVITYEQMVILQNNLSGGPMLGQRLKAQTNNISIDQSNSIRMPLQKSWI